MNTFLGLAEQRMSIFGSRLFEKNSTSGVLIVVKISEAGTVVDSGVLAFGRETAGHGHDAALSLTYLLGNRQPEGIKVEKIAFSRFSNGKGIFLFVLSSDLRKEFQSISLLLFWFALNQKHAFQIKTLEVTSTDMTFVITTKDLRLAELQDFFSLHIPQATKALSFFDSGIQIDSGGFKTKIFLESSQAPA